MTSEGKSPDASEGRSQGLGNLRREVANPGRAPGGVVTGGSKAASDEAAITRLVGAILLEQNDEWAVQRARYITLESISLVGDVPIVRLPIAAD